MNNENCHNCRWFQENLVTEGGYCDLQGIIISHEKVLHCHEHRKK